MSTRKTDFFEVSTQAVAELEQAVAAELQIPDPDDEKAKAILNGPSNNQDDSTSS